MTEHTSGHQASGEDAGARTVGADGGEREGGRPERMRQEVTDYVAALHGAYLDRARMLPPAVQGRLALIGAGSFSVAAVGARYLHFVATSERLVDASGRTASVQGARGPLRWTITFYDPVVIPELALVAESQQPQLERVRELLGVRTYLYHLTARPPAQLGAHHAGHAGTGLANAHAAAATDFQAIRRSVPAAAATLVDELEGAARAGLRRAQALLARSIAPRDERVRRLADEAAPDPDAVRAALLAAVRGPER